MEDEDQTVSDVDERGESEAEPADGEWPLALDPEERTGEEAGYGHGV
jgi:hypothetical protein